MDIETPDYFKNRTRTGKRNILPSNIGSRFVTQNFIRSTGITIVSTTLPGNSNVRVRFTVNPSKNPESILGTVPFQILFFENSISEDNLIPTGDNITLTDYVMYGPYALPNLKPGYNFGSDGFNIVHDTVLSREVAGSVSLLIVTQGRVIQTYSGGGSTGS